MKNARKDFVIVPDNTVLKALGCATFQAGQYGNTTTTIYANGVMQAVLFQEYTYDCSDQSYAAGLEAIVHAAMVQHLIDQGKLALQSSAGPLAADGWMVDSVDHNPSYLHDVAIATTEAPAPTWVAESSTVQGVVQFFVTAATGATGAVSITANYQGQLTNAITINLQAFQMSTSQLELQTIARVLSRKINTHHDLYALRYAYMPSLVKLEGLTHDGKHGFLLSTLHSPAASYANVLITFAQRDDSKFAGFYDPSLFPDGAGLSAGWSSDEKVFATQFNGAKPSYCAQYYCKGPGWDKIRQFTSSQIQEAKAAGIPFVAALENDGYQLWYDKPSSQEVDMADGAGTDVWQVAYDNCGNRIRFTLNYKDNNWDTENKTHISITGAESDGGYAGLPAPAWTRAEFATA